jgi:proline iminopeptidase
MLPTHLLDPTKKRNERPNRTRLGQAPPPPPPSLCVTGAMSQIGRFQIESTGTGHDGNDDDDDQCIVLSYIIFRPRQLHDTRKPPLLCLHGGPSIPSNYLLPVVNGVTDRAVIFYDQWGCGKSSRPRVSTAVSYDSNGKKSNQQSIMPFSIPIMVEHLRQLVEKCWKVKKFHLLGHSFGGILAFEYLKLLQSVQSRGYEGEQISAVSENRSPPEILSLVLSSTPTSAAVVQSESKRLYHNLQSAADSSFLSPNELPGNKDSNNDLGDNGAIESESNNEGTDGENDTADKSHSEGFHQTHECRLSQPPLALTDALAQAGPVEWRGIPAISDYEAMGTITRIPALLLRGEYDFCTDVCMAGWTDRILASGKRLQEEEEAGHIQTKTLSNCSHYAMLEDERQYGKAVSGFVQEHDPA